VSNGNGVSAICAMVLARASRVPLGEDVDSSESAKWGLMSASLGNECHSSITGNGGGQERCVFKCIDLISY
jgi:hypothetical protein